MNIDDSKGLTFPGHNLWITELLKLQGSLMDKYLGIEQKNGLQIPTSAPIFSLDDARTQWRIKDMFWRTLEEVAEAVENGAPGNAWRTQWDTNVDVRHFFEELADALHFMAEASILAEGYVPPDYIWEPDEDGPKYGSRILEDVGLFTKSLGLTANTLKNKPWKNSHMATDKTKFTVNFELAWACMADLFTQYGATPQDVWAWYTRKHQVNQFRQRTNY